jgi:hypothetical protein
MALGLVPVTSYQFCRRTKGKNAGKLIRCRKTKKRGWVAMRRKKSSKKR